MIGTRSARRLSNGTVVDLSRPISFRFNGKHYTGYQGDTLASALLANGVDVVGRSFKYARPRGIVGHGAEEPNAVVQLGTGARTVPNVKATQIALYDGLEASSVSGWPSVNFDLMSVIGLFGRLMPPGFYYKTFMFPARLWMTYERLIRKAAGLGKTPTVADPDHYDKLNQHCEILVIGGGPAGIMAAIAASDSEARVILVDEQEQLGGSLLASDHMIAGISGPEWIQSSLDILASRQNVLVLSRSTAFGYYDHNFVAVHERLTDHMAMPSSQPRQRVHRIRAQRVIFATGAFERPLVFAHNDVPGVMTASSISTYLKRYGVMPGQVLAVCTATDSGYQAAIDWVSCGGEVAGVFDTRSNPNGALYQRALMMGIEVRPQHAIIEAKGKKRVKSALIARLADCGDRVIGAAQTIKCDTIATSGGWSPTIHLASHTGSKPTWDETALGFTVTTPPPGTRMIGACNGAYRTAACFDQAINVASELLTELGFPTKDWRPEIPDVDEPESDVSQGLFLIPHLASTSRAPSQFVDFQLDVTAGAIELAAREGFESVEHVKRYTALGFGTDQGKLSNINGVGILARALDKTMDETGTTMFRPSYTPTTLGAIAGRDVGDLFDPERYTPMHRWHSENGALFEDVGQWKRPWYYPLPGESMQQAVNRECLAVRNAAGLLDASTLGKIDIQGPDAAEFITRIYTNSYLKLAPGKCRYGVMLKEDGMIFDDGVCACLDDNHYLMFTTTGGAAGVLEWLELWHQTEWPDLKVYLTSVTDHWATATLTGPFARKILSSVCDDIDLDKDAFGFMDWREGRVAGVQARIFRISFTGELSFEINVPAHYGRHLWEAIYEAGKPFGICPYGTETMHVLRAEKGFIIVGQDTDGSMTPSDMNMDWVLGKNKAFSYLGKRSLIRQDTARDDRKQLVGLKPLDPNQVIPEGAQIVFDPKQSLPMTMQGHVTSSYFSATLGHAFALAVVKGGLNRMGQTVYCPTSDGRILAAIIVSSVFYDPEGERHHVA